MKPLPPEPKDLAAATYRYVHDLDPCGECLKGRCDHCWLCDRMARHWRPCPCPACVKAAGA